MDVPTFGLERLSALPLWLAVVLLSFLFVGIVLASTRIYTTLRYRLILAQHSSAATSTGPLKQPRVLPPPPVPYTLPFLGHALAFLNKVPGAFWQQLFTTFPRAIGACTLNLGGVATHILFSPSTVQALLRHRSLTRHTFNIDVITKGFGCSLPEAHKYHGLSEGPDEAGMTPQQHLEEFNHSYLLRTESVNELTAEFMGTLRDQLATAGGTEWQAIDLYAWFWPMMFQSSTVALMGSSLLDIYPELPEDFRAFDDALLSLFYGIPRWIKPQPYATRDRILSGMKRWLQAMRERCGADVFVDPAGPVGWEPNYGSRANRAKQGYYARRGLNHHTRAAFDVGFLFGLSSNAIPATAWMLMHLLDPRGDATLLPRVLAELESVPVRDNGVPDVAVLVGLPLLQAVYNETLRLYVDVLLTRDVSEDLTLPLDDGRRALFLQKGGALFVPSYLAHRDTTVWGGTLGGPPAHVFYPERFLKHDPETGKASFTTNGTVGRLFPFGGGKTMWYVYIVVL